MSIKTTRLKATQTPRIRTIDISGQMNGTRQTFALTRQIQTWDTHYLVWNSTVYRNDRNHRFYSIGNDGWSLTTYFDHAPQGGNGHTLQLAYSSGGDGEDDVYTKGDVDRLIDEEAEARKAADQELSDRIDREVQERKDADEAERNAREAGDNELSAKIDDETRNRIQGDNDLQSQLDAMAAASDVVDIVNTKAELDAYNKKDLTDKDVIKVLNDESQGGATTYYRYDKPSNVFNPIGSVGPYYTKSETDNKINEEIASIPQPNLYEYIAGMNSLNSSGFLHWDVNNGRVTPFFTFMDKTNGGTWQSSNQNWSVPFATTSTPGVLRATDYSKLSNLLNIQTIGTGLTLVNGVLSVDNSGSGSSVNLQEYTLSAPNLNQLLYPVTTEETVVIRGNVVQQSESDGANVALSTLPAATSLKAGVMTAADKTKIDSIDISKMITTDNINNYISPTDLTNYYTKTEVNNLFTSKLPESVIGASGGDAMISFTPSQYGLGINYNTYTTNDGTKIPTIANMPFATTTACGVMSADDKAKLDSLTTLNNASTNSSMGTQTLNSSTGDWQLYKVLKSGYSYAEIDINCTTDAAIHSDTYAIYFSADLSTLTSSSKVYLPGFSGAPEAGAGYVAHIKLRMYRDSTDSNIYVVAERSYVMPNTPGETVSSDTKFVTVPSTVDGIVIPYAAGRVTVSVKTSKEE